MNWFSGLVLFIVIWWTLLFAVLPFAVRSQLEDGDVVEGSERGAPAVSHIKKKFLITTIIAFIIWVAVCAVIIFDLFSLSDLPFIPKTSIDG